MLPQILADVQPLAATTSGAVVFKNILRAGVAQSRQDNWCWAAVAQGVGLAYGSKPGKQCEIASRTLGKSCCASGPNNPCDVVHFLSRALGDHHADVHPVDVATVKSEIDGGRPVCARMADRMDDEEGHFVMISGYGSDPDGNEFFLVWDPDSGNPSEQEVEEFTRSYREHWRWDYSYITKPHPTRGNPSVPSV